MAAVFTNLSIYLAIAEEALAESTRLLEAGRTPKPDGQPGYILSSDPGRKSFKQSFIAIAFAGMYLEALVALIGRARLGKAFYDEKLKVLGVNDERDLASCKRFRETRNNLIHEKALDFEALRPDKKIRKKEIRVAQEEASLAVDFVKSIGSKLQPAP
jgi:hypothetical protein